jgi:hypothetical protein
MIPRVQKGGVVASWFGRVEDDKQTKHRNYLHEILVVSLALGLT